MVYRICLGGTSIAELEDDESYAYEVFEKTVELADALNKTASLINAETGELLDYSD